MEMTLGGDQLLSMVHRLKWNTATSTHTIPSGAATDAQVDPTAIMLAPMVIRTFICGIVYN